MSEVRLENLMKSFRGIPAVRGVNLEVRKGEFMTLVGPSGCGKSTVLNMIAGLEDPDRGEILFDGDRVNTLSPPERDIAFVFQSYALYPHKTVRENLAFPLKMMRLTPAETAERISRAAGLLELGDLLDRMPRELSGGQRQRVALGRAIVRKPRVFLLDEPLSNLDAKLRVHMRAELKRLHQELGITFIYVTHDQTEAMTLSDRLAVMNDGVILQCGTPEEVYGNPAGRFVASFIGSPPMNFVDCRWEATREVALPGGGRLRPAPGKARSLWDAPGGTPVTLGIRPEHISISETPFPESAPVRVYVVEPTGADCFVTIVLGGTKVIVRAEPGFLPRPGGEVHVRPDPAQAYFFNPESGVRLR